MTRSKLSLQEVKFRPAEPGDAKIASRLLFESFPRMAAFIIGLGSKERAEAILARVFPLTGHRFSYENAVIAQYQGRVAGISIGFPTGMSGKFNRRFSRLVIRRYRPGGKFALIIRAWPLVFIKEADRDAYLLSNLAVRKRLHGGGLEQYFLSHIEKIAAEAGCAKVALMIPIGDKSKRQFFEENGYKIKAIQLESNKRVPYLGAGYQQMVKELAA